MPILRLVKIKFIGLGFITLTEKVIKRPFLPLEELLGARIVEFNDFYLFGTLQSHSNCMNLMSGYAGFIMNSVDAKNCDYSTTFDVSEGLAETFPESTFSFDSDPTASPESYNMTFS